MRVHAVIQLVEGHFEASCLEFEAIGEGPTRDQALESLRSAIQEREQPEAVAPPESSAPPSVEIVVAEDEAEESLSAP